MDLTIIYKSYADDSRHNRKFHLNNNRDILELVLWLSAIEGAVVGHPQARKVFEIIVDGHHFKTDKYLNPSDWTQEIKTIIKDL